MSGLRKATGGYDEVPSDWMSATGTRALVLQDPCLLWLEHHGHKFGFKEDPEEYSFLNFIGAAGQKFEEHWLKNFAPNAVYGLEKDWDVRKVEGLQRTVALMQAGHPVISKAALWWAPEKIYGTADLICKQSWLAETFPGSCPQPDGRDGYVVVDAKFTRNLASSKAADLRMYSHQLRLYSYMLGNIQGQMPESAYLVTRDRIADPIPVGVEMKLGQPLDPELARLRDLHLHIKLHGADYRPWQDEIVAPGLGNKKDEPWHLAKKKIVKALRGTPLEMLPHIGAVQKKGLKAFGFEHLEDLLCPEAAEFPFHALAGIGEQTERRIQAVLAANRTGEVIGAEDAILPPRCDVELFVDFEFFSDINVDFENDWPKLNGCPIIFMIGAGWLEKGTWKFRQFVAAEEYPDAERKMFENFLSFLHKMGIFDNARSAALYHWSPAEKWQADAAESRHGLKRLSDLPWVDLRKVFADTPIGIRGAWGYGLKEIVMAVGEYAPQFHSPWPEDLSSGLSAMVMGWEAYKQPRPLDSPEMSTLSKYLEADVKGLMTVLRWLQDQCPGPYHNQQASGRGGWYAMARAG